MFEIERVTDWSKRIDGYDNNQKSKYEMAFEKMRQLKEMLQDKSDGWSMTIDDKNDKMTCEQRILERGFNEVRCSSYSDHDCLTTWRAFMNVDNKYQYDTSVEKFEILRQVGSNLVFGYTKLYGIFTVASRDCYAYQYFNIEPNGAIYCCIFDDE